MELVWTEATLLLRSTKLLIISPVLMIHRAPGTRTQLTKNGGTPQGGITNLHSHGR